MRTRYRKAIVDTYMDAIQKKMKIKTSEFLSANDFNFSSRPKTSIGGGYMNTRTSRNVLSRDNVTSTADIVSSPSGISSPSITLSRASRVKTSQGTR